MADKQDKIQERKHEVRVVRRDRYMFLRVEHLGKLLGIKLRGESSLLYHPDEFKSGVNLWEGSSWIVISR